MLYLPNREEGAKSPFVVDLCEHYTDCFDQRSRKHVTLAPSKMEEAGTD